jgi:hypothetical protein
MDDVETVIREAGGKRADGIPFPLRSPEGWVHLSVAVAKITAKLLTDRSWTDVYAGCLGLASTEPTPNTEDGRASEEAANYVADEFVTACRLEVLKSGYRRVGGGGPVVPMPSEWWDTEDLFLRFRTWSIDPDDILSDRLDLPCWIWIEDESLTRLCDKIWRHLSGVRKDVIKDDQLITVRQALDLLEPFVPQLGGDVRSDRAPDGARELIAACADGAVRTLAERMERSFDANGGGIGKLIEAENDCDIPADLWNAVALTPIQNWAAGTLVAKPDARNTYRLKRVLIDRLDLMHYLEGMGLLVRVQYRRKGEEEHFLEGFAPAVPVDLNDGEEVVETAEKSPDHNVIELFDDTPDNSRPAHARKRGRKTNAVWAKCYAKAYANHRKLALGYSDEQFRDWIQDMNPSLREQASPQHHKSIKSYRDRAERGEFDHLLGR